MLRPGKIEYVPVGYDGQCRRHPVDGIDLSLVEKFHQLYREGKIRLWDYVVRASALYGRKQIRHRHGEIKWCLGSENRISAEPKLLTDPGCITDDAPVGENCAFWHPR